MPNITPFLWYDGTAVEAATLYVSIFKGAKIVSPPADELADPSTVMMVKFEIDGRAFMAFNGGPAHEFSEAISLFVDCETQAEIDSISEGLIAGGGEQRRCGWVRDRFGVSWQIVPSILGDLMQSDDETKSEAVLHAMLGMHRLDIAKLRAAYDGA